MALSILLLKHVVYVVWYFWYNDTIFGVLYISYNQNLIRFEMWLQIYNKSERNESLFIQDWI